MSCQGDFCLNSAQNDLYSLRLSAYCNYLSSNSAKGGYFHISRMSLDNKIYGDTEILLFNNNTDLGIEVSEIFNWSFHIKKNSESSWIVHLLKHSDQFNLI